MKAHDRFVAGSLDTMSTHRRLRRMVSPRPESTVAIDEPSDDHLVARVLDGDVGSFTVLMRRNNRRLFRVVRGILRDDAEAEDACQDTWLRAYANLARLERPSAFSSWIARIGLRCALARVTKRKGLVSLDEFDQQAAQGSEHDPEVTTQTRRLAQSTEQALDALLPSYRLVLLMREVEHMSTAETAALLGVSEENVRVRLHRARARLRELLSREFGSDVLEVLAFDGERCDRLVGAVVRAIYSDARYAARSVRWSLLRPSPSNAS